jgi:hypothetical protein
VSIASAWKRYPGEGRAQFPVAVSGSAPVRPACPRSRASCGLPISLRASGLTADEKRLASTLRPRGQEGPRAPKQGTERGSLGKP